MRIFTNNNALILVGIVCLVILAAGVSVGIWWIWAGLSYQHFDAQSAYDMIEYLKETNPAHYAKIISPEDSTYLNDLKSFFTTSGDRTTIALGTLILFGSILVSISLFFSAVVLMYLRTVQREPQFISEETVSKEEAQEVTQEITEPETPEEPVETTPPTEQLEEPQPAEPLSEEPTPPTDAAESVVPEEPEETTAPSAKESEESTSAAIHPEEPPASTAYVGPVWGEKESPIPGVHLETDTPPTKKSEEPESAETPPEQPSPAASE